MRTLGSPCTNIMSSADWHGRIFLENDLSSNLGVIFIAKCKIKIRLRHHYSYLYLSAFVKIKQKYVWLIHSYKYADKITNIVSKTASKN